LERDVAIDQLGDYTALLCTQLSLQSSNIPATFGKGRAFHLYPGAIITNSTDHCLDVREFEELAADDAISEIAEDKLTEVYRRIKDSIGQPHPFGTLKPGEKLAITEHLRSDRLAIKEHLRVQVSMAGSGKWSGAIPLVDSHSGSQDLLVGDDVFCAQVAPSKGLISLELCQGSRLSCANETSEKVVVSTVGGETEFAVEPQKSREIGFVSPFLNRQTEVNVRLGARPARPINLLAVGNQPGGGFTVSVTLRNGLKVLTVTGGEAERPVSFNLEIELSLPRVGVSLVTEKEELHAEASVIRAHSMSTSEMHALKLQVSEVQADFHCEKREMPVVLSNRVEGLDRPAILLEVVQAASLQEVSHFLKVDVSLDSIEVDVSDELLQFIAEFGAARRTEPVAAASMDARPLVDTFVVPRVPPIVQVDELKIDTVGLHLWLKLALSNVQFLPEALKVVVRLLSFSGHFTLDGALITLPERTFDPHRGSLGAFLDCLKNEYSASFVKSLFSLLGHSSLLNVGRFPLKIGQDTVGYALNTATTAVNEVGGLIEFLTFDDDYVREQQRLRRNKRITGVGDGLAEGGKRIGEGVLGLFDVVVKPIEGVQEGRDFGEKICGFCKGVGTGAVGTIVKPVSKIGQAATDIVGGVHAQVCEEAPHAKRICEVPLRPQRLLYGPLYAAFSMDPSAFDANAKAELGAIDGVEAVIPLGRPGDEVDPNILGVEADPNSLMVLLVFSSGLRLCEMEAPVQEVSHQEETGADVVRATKTIVTQLFKPVKRLGEVTLARPSASSMSLGEEKIRNVKRTISFENQEVQDVRVTEQGIEIQTDSGTLTVPTTAVSKEVSTVLLHGIQRSIEGRSPDWMLLREAVWRAREGEIGESAEEEDTKVVSVWQFERFYVGKGWKAPGGVPLDGDTMWVWCNAREPPAKHPHLKQGLSVEDAQAAREPPIEMGLLWTAVDSSWECKSGPHTDAEGWMYAHGMHAGTWEPTSVVSSFVRKREWIRQYR
jgi:hypothetical protein